MSAVLPGWLSNGYGAELFNRSCHRQIFSPTTS